MTDLPIASTSPIAAVRPVANALQHGAPGGCTGAPADDDPFRAVLVQELGLLHPRRALSAPALPAVPAKAVVRPETGDDTTQADAPADAPPAQALVGVIPLPPVFSDAPGTPPTGADPSSLTTARTQAATGRTALVLDPPAESSAASATAAQLPALPAAADLAAPGKFVPATAGEARREIAFDASLLEQHKEAPTAASAIHVDAAPPQSTRAVTATLNATVGQHGWDQGLGDQLVWMAGQKQQVAELHLNPPDLGPLKITLTLDNDRASAQFVSAHVQVREAIEAAMPRLREMLADSGIALGNASVSADAFREQAQPQPQSQPREYTAQPGAATANQGAITQGAQLLRLARGLIDTYA